MDGKEGLNNEFKNSSFRAVLIYSIIEYSEVKINYGYKIFIKRKMGLLLTNLKRTSKKRMLRDNMPKKVVSKRKRKLEQPYIVFKKRLIILCLKVKGHLENFRMNGFLFMKKKSKIAHSIKQLVLSINEFCQFLKSLSMLVSFLKWVRKVFNHAALLGYIQAHPAAPVTSQSIKKKLMKKRFFMILMS
ncbi:hypothetical protein RU85_GL001752 [Lactococcus garvieae]|nr:hypothetical protein RU85_GL001752 [Lactococcus garvieae]